MTEIILGILVICVIPPIINMAIVYISVKFNIWNWITRALYCENYANTLNPDDIKRGLIPVSSFLLLFQFVLFGIGTVIYYVIKFILIPFRIVIDFIHNCFMSRFNKIESKREFYDKLNKKN